MSFGLCDGPGPACQHGDTHMPPPPSPGDRHTSRHGPEYERAHTTVRERMRREAGVEEYC
eukprot:6825291-Prymnesium_polylepis.1